ncbi:MAG: hypothetical protein KGL53_13995 [Elusimicrobia bacterium]|nr:hypothetical protein [Elusimicrobiota bacterium]
MRASWLLAALAAAAWAGASPSGEGRGPQTPVDAAMAPVLAHVEARMPDYDAVADAEVQVPARTIALGLNSRMYRCWRLELTGDHGRQALEVFERLRSQQDALKDLKERLAKDVVAYTAAPKPEPDLAKAVSDETSQLDGLVEAFDKTVEAAARAKLLKSTQGGLLSGQRTYSPVMTKDDYTMVRDEASPECRR